MLYLNGTTDILYLTTGSAVAAGVEVAVTWARATNGSPPVPAEFKTDVFVITTATDTVLLTGVAGSVYVVKHVSAVNDSSTTTTTAYLQISRDTGTTKILLEPRTFTLLPGEQLDMPEDGPTAHIDANGAVYGAAPALPARNLGATGVLAETIPRQLCPEVNTTVAASGTLFMQAIYLTAGQLVSTVDLWSATTAAGTPTNYAVGLYDVNRNLLANSANQTTAAWAANSIKSFAMTTPYRVPTSGQYYIGYYMTATTVATLKGGTAKTGGQLAAAAPSLNGASSTGLTTALPNPAAAITGGTASIYAAVR